MTAKMLREFEAAMLDIYRRAKLEAGYNATIFLKMLHDKGGVATAKALIGSRTASDGYTHLFERGRLDLTVEAMVVGNSKWHTLFSIYELTAARQRLISYGYKI